MTVKTELDRDRIIPLWINIFGDDEAYINAFLDVVEKEGRYFGAYDVCGELLSMLFLVDVPIRHEDYRAKCAYMYACATRSDCRGKGVFKELFTNAKTALENDGYDCVFCVPANEGLFGFYEKLGFDKVLCRRKIYAQNDGKVCGKRFEEKRGNDAYGIYLKSIPNDMCLPVKSRAVFDLSLFASEAMFYAFDGGYLVYDSESVCEICASDGKETEVLREAARFFGKDMFAYTFPKENDREKYAALCVLSEWKLPDNAYANLLMD